jgi:hypothetical protein
MGELFHETTHGRAGQSEDSIVDSIIFRIIVCVDRCLDCTWSCNKCHPFVDGFSHPQVVDPHVLLLCTRRDGRHVSEAIGLNGGTRVVPHPCLCGYNVWFEYVKYKPTTVLLIIAHGIVGGNAPVTHCVTAGILLTNLVIRVHVIYPSVFGFLCVPHAV